MVPHQNAVAVVIRQLSAERSPACLLDASGSFLFVNEAWDAHALRNGGGSCCLGSALIGSPWLDHIGGHDVRRRHAELLAGALRPEARRVTHVAESNTPDVAALLSTRFDPVLAHDEPVAVAIVHTIVRERPIGEVYDVVATPREAYAQPGGLVEQCSCCRRVRDPVARDRWDLVPDLIARPAPATHALCELCATLHYPAA